MMIMPIMQRFDKSTYAYQRTGAHDLQPQLLKQNQGTDSVSFKAAVEVTPEEIAKAKELAQTVVQRVDTFIDKEFPVILKKAKEHARQFADGALPKKHAPKVPMTVAFDTHGNFDITHGEFETNNFKHQIEGKMTSKGPKIGRLSLWNSKDTIASNPFLGFRYREELPDGNTQELGVSFDGKLQYYSLQDSNRRTIKSVIFDENGNVVKR